MANDILGIPEELLIKILANLDAVALTRCAMTCTSVSETVKSSSLLAYTIQLHFNGVCTTGKSVTQPYHELIDLLLHRRQAQMFPKWTINTTLQMRCTCFSSDLSGSIFFSTDTKNLELGVLPTFGSANEPGVLSKSLEKPDFSVSRFAVDVSQNLIVMIEDDSEIMSSRTDTRVVNIHIRTLMDTPHPLALQDHLQFIVEPDESGNTADNASIQIARNILSFFFCSDQEFGQSEPRVLIWDWVTSDLLLDSATSSPPLLPSWRSDFALLDATYFFVTCASNSGSIKLYKLARSPASTAHAVHLATLHLPPIGLHVEIERIVSHAGGIEALPLPHTPFAVHDDDRLHVFTIEYIYSDPAQAHNMQRSRLAYLNLFVHQRVLTRYCTQRGRSRDTMPLDIPWAAWGPPNTKIIYPARFSGEHSGTRTVHGQRVVHSRVDRPAHGFHGLDLVPTYDSVEVLDFSLAAVLSAGGVLPMPQSSSEGHFPGKLLSSSKLGASQCPLFADDVETRLPCVSFTAKLDRRYAKFMIYADGVVGLNFPSDLLTMALAACLDVYTI